MKNIYFLLLTALLYSCNNNQVQKMDKGNEITPTPDYVLVIHGGAGSRTPGNEENDLEYRQTLEHVLRMGDSMLAAGSPALDVVEACLRVLENDQKFNAGKGAVFAADHTNKLDASIMDGATLMAGAVAGVSRIKNPISLARQVMEQSKHVLLSGKDAEVFAVEQGIDLVDPAYFFTQKNYDYLLKVQQDEKYGTVGCVVLDRNGHLAAGTSTGGMTNKKYGRVGDSPIIGAGTYAEDGVCAVSATGHGEYFIRYVVAHDIAARIKYGGFTLDSASKWVIMEQLKNAGGNGGVICLDAQGNVSMPFNTPAMFRGYIKAGEEMVVEIY